MIETKLTELVLTCNSWQEAQDIIDCLVNEGLVIKTEIMESVSSVSVIVKAAYEKLEDIKTLIEQVSSTILLSITD